MKREKAELLKKIHGGQTCQIVATATRLKIFDTLYEHPLSCDELSGHLHIESATLRRLLFALVALYLLETDQNGQFALTLQGRYLASQHEDSLHALAIYKGSPLLWDAQGKMYEGIRQNKSPFELHFGTDLFSHLSEHEEHMRLFQDAMDCYTTQSSSVLLETYRFDRYTSLLDIGGGRGTFLKKLQTIHPHIQGASLDLPQALRGIHSGITPIPGSFFDSIPKGYDSYMLRNILHDWSDEKCIRILRTIREALTEATPLLIIEALVEPTTEKRLGKFADLTMFMMTPGGKERSLEEFESLFHESGLVLSETVRTTGSKALIEVRPSLSSS